MKLFVDVSLCKSEPGSVTEPVPFEEPILGSWTLINLCDIHGSDYTEYAVIQRMISCGCM